MDSLLIEQTPTDDKIIADCCSYQWLNSKVDISEAPQKKSWFRKKDPVVEKPLEDAKEKNSFILDKIYLSIKAGSKVAICGPVGCGKSSLLSGIIGEMPQISGIMHRYGSIAYCSQQPWILTDTVEGNIIFNQKLDEKKLQGILSAVGLDTDLKQFPNGRMTGIGEKGINLSGGQKARVALARALYSESDIYLLDDPISALDAHVGHMVFETVIKKYLKDKTVLLVTHQLQLLPEMDFVVVMENGKIVEQGTFNDLMARKSVLFGLMKNYQVGQKTTIEKKDEAKDGPVKNDGKSSDIIVAEDQERGAVNAKVFWSYITSCGGWFYIIPLVLAAVCNSGTQLTTNLWLTWWINDKYGLSTDKYLFWYGILGLIQFGFALVLNTVFLTGGYNAAKTYHKAALARLMGAPMGFFDSQPIGRILNRMSKDIESVDQQIWIISFLATISIAGLLASASLLIYTNQIMVALVVPLFCIYGAMLVYYQRSNREFKRFESTFRSPLYSHVSETLAGLATIKAYGTEGQFINKQRVLMDDSNTPAYMRLSAAIWIGIRMEVLSTLLTLTLSLLGVSSSSNPSLIGLALTYSGGITGLLNLLLISTSQLETEFNSVERLSVYCDEIAQESPAHFDNDPGISEWPSCGKISFRNISLAYPSRPDILILKELSLDIKAGEKVGVIGRTGSGKSTLMTALFRIVELKEGTILIDGQGNNRHATHGRHF